MNDFPARTLRVLKFGGSSLSTTDGLKRAVSIAADRNRTAPTLVVVSALGDSTDRLAALAANRERADVSVLSRLYRLHVGMARSLLAPPSLERYRQVLDREISLLAAPIRRITTGSDDLFDRELVLSAGERFSAPLFSAALRHTGCFSIPVDASALIRIRDREGRKIDTDSTRDRIRDWYLSLSPGLVPVVTGFVGSSGCGKTLTLGRGGSDLTAALIAGVLSADVLERWTDVDGLFTDDPRLNPLARKLDFLRLSDALSLNRESRLGMHRASLEPLRHGRTAVHVRSFSSPGEGTLIVPDDRENAPGGAATPLH